MSRRARAFGSGSVLVVLAGLAGCFQPSLEVGELRCGASGQCPAGLTCDPGSQRCFVPGEAPDAAPPRPDAGPPPPPPPPEPDAGPVGRCGDGTVDPGEACDDGDASDLGSCDAACAHECLEGEHVFGADGRCYFPLRAAGPVTFDAAASACGLLGAHLVVVGGVEEEALLVASFCPTPDCAPLWIGLSDRAVEGRLDWVDGEPLGFVDFHPAEPNNAPFDADGEDCIRLEGRVDTGVAAWNDVSCNAATTALASNVPLCEREPGTVGSNGN